METNSTKRIAHRVLVLLGCAGVGIALAWAVISLWGFFADGAQMRRWIDEWGALAPIAMGALVAAQVVLAVLPGEPVELAAGYLFGF